MRRLISICTLALLIFVIHCAREDRDQPVDNGQKMKAPQISFEGRIVFQSNMDGDNEIFLLTEEGLTRLTDNDWQDEYPVWSPDGTRIAFTADPEGNYDIQIMNADGSGIEAVTSSDLDEKEPAWYPDGKQIAYSREKKGLLRKNIAVFKVNLQTGAVRAVLPRYDKTHAIPDISPAGMLLTFTGKRTMGWDAAVCNLDTRSVLFLEDGGKSCRARFSGDGETLAYVSSKADGKGDIWLIRPDGSDRKRLTIRDETYDYFPSWSPDGRFVVFNSSRQHDHNGDWALYVVDVDTGWATLLFDSPGNDVFPDWH